MSSLSECDRSRDRACDCELRVSVSGSGSVGVGRELDDEDEDADADELWLWLFVRSLGPTTSCSSTVPYSPAMYVSGPEVRASTCSISAVCSLFFFFFFILSVASVSRRVGSRPHGLTGSMGNVRYRSNTMRTDVCRAELRAGRAEEEKLEKSHLFRSEHGGTGERASQRTYVESRGPAPSCEVRKRLGRFGWLSSGERKEGKKRSGWETKRRW
ncbi:hypothetical protein BZA05DRAFT_97913 [Tricharina praecox]|uniref:uncharacterized protein n=1 Tax=Tricharina praecox TaxID=43433 RepID=UPI00221F7FA5|nr:uncharacterized protein BZA05DRAFT_97913 [Tricharina praecox]KAI5857502.1 hypothetical protein BZA05DRAFT_97913 [Tricharina praecox]